MHWVFASCSKKSFYLNQIFDMRDEKYGRIWSCSNVRLTLVMSQKYFHAACSEVNFTKMAAIHANCPKRVKFPLSRNTV